MGCELWSEKLEIYLDGELPAEETRLLDRHVRECPACASDALSRVQLKRAVQVAGKRFTASAEFRRNLELRVAGRSRSRVFQKWMPALATTAVLLVVAFGVTSQLSKRSQEAGIYSELADMHVATLASANPVDVVSTDRHTVKPWFQGKLPFTFELPELKDTEFSLMGGRVSYLGQTPGAHLLYQVRKHRISVFVYMDRHFAPAMPSSASASQSSFNVQTWSQQGMRYFVIGDAISFFNDTATPEIYTLSRHDALP